MKSAQLQLRGPCPSFFATVQYVGPGCCYEFVLNQYWGMPGDFLYVTATINTPGATVASANSLDGAPPPTYTVGGTTISFHTRTSDGLYFDPHRVSICFTTDGSVHQPISVTFTARDQNGNACTGGCTGCSQTVTLSNAACLDPVLCAVPLTGFTPDRFGGLPADRMQVVAMYDGNGTASLEIELWNPTTLDCCSVVVSPIANNKIVTLEYNMQGYEPTGVFTVSGVTPNGVIDGVAFGLYLRDTASDRWMMRSTAPGIGAGTPNFVGGWPIAWSESKWNVMMTSIVGTTYNEFVARRQAQMTLSGAQLLSNGVWHIRTGRIVGDLNGDGCVDQTDTNLLMGSVGACCP